jgi:hypothetical protein
MAFRKLAALTLALASVLVYVGCTEELNGPSTTDDQPVLPPTNVTAAMLSDGHVRVAWDASSDPTINGYNLYRREVGSGGPHRINGTRIMDTQYLDNGATAPKTYEYRLTAVNAKGKQSHYVAVYIETEVLNSGGDKLPVPELN